MSYLYNEPILAASSIVAPKRTARPSVDKEAKDQCPFCKENAHMLEHLWLEKHTEAEDRIRIVNNKYPITGEDLKGAHDVVIDTLKHNRHIATFGEGHWYDLLEIMQKRYRMLAKENECIQIFKNNGQKAGASIAHSHWQIVALAQIPYTLMQHYEKLEEASRKTGCYLCHQMVMQTLGEVILESDRWWVIAPYVSGFPHETWLLPKRHFGDLAAMTDDEMRSLGQLMMQVTKAYQHILPDGHYNICMMNGKVQGDEYYHFYIRFLPRIGQIAGFELATGCFIQSVEPREHAKQMAALMRDWREEE
ncbi:MAG: galactose-1-phosphate uridylyltransferase [Cellulosilyticaceae bacterium]